MSMPCRPSSLSSARPCGGSSMTRLYRRSVSCSSAPRRLRLPPRRPAPCFVERQDVAHFVHRGRTLPIACDLQILRAVQLFGLLDDEELAVLAEQVELQ